MEISDLEIKIYPLSDLTTLWLACSLAFKLFDLKTSFRAFIKYLLPEILYLIYEMFDIRNM